MDSQAEPAEKKEHAEDPKKSEADSQSQSNGNAASTQAEEKKQQQQQKSVDTSNVNVNDLYYKGQKIEIDEDAAAEDIQLMINQQREEVQSYNGKVARHATSIPHATPVPHASHHAPHASHHAPHATPQVPSGPRFALLICVCLISQQQPSVEMCTMNELKEAGKLDLSKVDDAQYETLIQPPECFVGKLKEYQLKGLRWLDNLYDQCINGILADEMGLGKTIQAIALFSHICYNKGAWGPFLVVTQSSILCKRV